MSRVLYLDCFAGAAGDMLLGALIDLGVPIDEVRRALGSLGLEEGFRIEADRVLRSGVSATKFRVIEPPGDKLAHPHRHLSGIAKLIGRSSLSAAAQERAVTLFRRLAEAEAAIHEMPLEKVHLHEVGALDSIIDIVGAVHALEVLGIDDVVASPLNVGSGTVECAHGTFPVPAPATARILAGVPVYASGPSMELVTPTGALLVSGYARSFGPMPAMTIERIGYGAGDREVKGFPNVLRAIAGERVAEARRAPALSAAPGHSPVVEIRCEIDDMNPQIFGALMDRLLQAGALDVFYAPVQMKKNRPGTLATVLCAPDARESILDVLFRETTTIGVRWLEMNRECLERRVEVVRTAYGEIRFKIALRNGEVVNATPEFDDCQRAAAAHGAAVKDVQAQALAAYLQGRAAHAR
jgi:hypothetical protein